MNGFRQVSGRIVVFVILNCLCAAFVIAGTQTTEFSYYSNNRKHILDVSSRQIAVKFKETAGQGRREEVVNEYAVLEPFSKREEISTFKLTLLPLREGKSTEEVLQTINSLKNKSEVETVSPVFDMHGSELMVTDEFIVKFQPSVSEEEINAFNDLNDVEIARKP